MPPVKRGLAPTPTGWLRSPSPALTAAPCARESGRTGDSAAEEYLNELNKALQARLEVGGEVFVSNAVLEGRYLLRACIVNFRTSAKDIAEIPGIISRYGLHVHQELKPRT